MEKLQEANNFVSGKCKTALMENATWKRMTDNLVDQQFTMPVLFIGHGSPMNGIQHNLFSDKWKSLAKKIPEPQAVLVVSAHWQTKGTRVTAMEFPRTIHDFGGFPDSLYQVQYPAPGHPQLAEMLAGRQAVIADHDWGLDHGTWTIVRHMYPEARIPVLQLSLDKAKKPQHHFELARELQYLRQKGVLIVGSGNLVHNLGLLSWKDIEAPGYAFDWAHIANEKFKDLIGSGNFQALIQYHSLGKEARLAIPTPEHFLPLLYTLGLKKHHEEIEFFNDLAVGGSLTMTSVALGL